MDRHTETTHESASAQHPFVDSTERLRVARQLKEPTDALSKARRALI